MSKKFKLRLLTYLAVFLPGLSLLLGACGDAATPSASNATTAPVVATSAAANSATTAAITVATNPATTNAPGNTNAATTAAPATTANATTTTAAAKPTTVVALPTVNPNAVGKLVYGTFTNSKYEVFTINKDGSDKKKIVDGSSPVFSPDGKRIAFAGMIEGEFGIRPMQMGIFSVDLNGGNKQLLCKPAANTVIQLRRWSPSGRFIAFGATPAQVDGAWVINLCNPADGSTFALKRGEDKAWMLYDWSPDGNYAVWQVNDKGTYKLYYGDPDLEGKDAVLLASGKYEIVGIVPPYFMGARFSPDGKTIAYITEDKIGFVSVPGQKSPLDGQTITMGKDKFRDADLVFSPNGKTLIAPVQLSNDQKSTLRFFGTEGEELGRMHGFPDQTVYAISVDWTRS